MLAASACRLPTFEGDVPRVGMMSLDYTVDRMRVVAVRASPPQGPAGTPRTLESLVVGPDGTIRDATVSYSTCGLSETVSVGVSDLRCFENPALVTDLGQGEPGSWDVPPVAFPDCRPFDAVGDWDALPGEHCSSVVPLLAEVTGPDGGVASGANYVAIPATEVPEHVQVRDETGEITEIEPSLVTPVGSPADPTLPVSITADGAAAPGAEVALAVTLEDPHYNRVAWWVTGGTLDQSGRTVITRSEGVGHAYNRWTLPREVSEPLTVWVVLTEWAEPWGEIPEATSIAISQPAWAELTLEVE